MKTELKRVWMSFEKSLLITFFATLLAVLLGPLLKFQTFAGDFEQTALILVVVGFAVIIMEFFGVLDLVGQKKLGPAWKLSIYSILSLFLATLVLPPLEPLFSMFFIVQAVLIVLLAFVGEAF